MAAKQDVEDFTRYADKPATGTMEAFADWLIEEVGVTFPNRKAEEQFRDGVRLGGTLRMEFQASDFWRTDERNPRSPAGKKARATANGVSDKPKATRGRAKPDPEPEDDTEDEAPVKPATRRGRPAAAKATGTKAGAKPATTRGRGRAKPAAEKESAEAPY